MHFRSGYLGRSTYDLWKWLSRCNHFSTAKPLNLSDFKPELIRNFCIIAHIDHGKSTLVDRLLEYTGVIEKSQANAQVLDKLSVERARGITVKARSAAMFCRFENQTFLLNLLDTPGHADFTYEVKKSIMASDNALLLVDACEGVMAQTLATFHMATSRGLKVIPVLNKIDLPTADPPKVKQQLKLLLGINPNDVLSVSAKRGTNIEDIIATLILDGKCPSVDDSMQSPAHFVVLDSEHRPFRGVVVTVLTLGGNISPGMDLRIVRNGRAYKVREVGILSPDERSCEALYPGQVGFVSMDIRTPSEVVTGDVFYSGSKQSPTVNYIEPPKPVVYAGIYPVTHGPEHKLLRDALEKLCLNDPSVECTSEKHPALGAGWRLGFMGLLHMDVFRQRLEEEYGANLILTCPSVSYRVRLKGKKNIQKYGGEWVTIHDASMLDNCAEEYEEMHVQGSIIVPEPYLSPTLKLCLSRRGKLLSQDCLDETLVHISMDFPLSEVIVDFHDQLKTVSSGFASFEFAETGWQPADLTKLSVQLNGKVVEELTQLVPKASFIARARHLADALAKQIPRQQFLIKIQVLAQNRSVARADVKPYRKDVTAKLHAADPSRRNKLLQRQSEGKKRLRMIGNITVPQEAFINVLKRVP
uniref:Translation factor GUF1 homolog, mitochondrial n=3 Tax=Schistocephalus solidus TaxID=70667 RepID=A0A0X3NHP2_SCHSO